MSDDASRDVSLHNVAATTEAGWTDGGRRLHRLPLGVAERLTADARDRMRHPTGSELRFVPADLGEPVDVTVSAPVSTTARVFWGRFQGKTVHELGPEPRRLRLRPSDRLAALADPAGHGTHGSHGANAKNGKNGPYGANGSHGTFDSRVCRLRFEPNAPVAVHDVAGACRPPTADETPARRLLAYGTSITEGEDASATHLSYVAQAARRLGMDALNLGAAGSAFCEPGLADHVADRADWDVAVLELSVNMANHGFTPEQFDDRVESFVRTIADANPGRPVVCVTLLPYFADLTRDGDRDRADRFRAGLREAADATEADNVHLVEGSALLDAAGLTTDLLHPGDAGMTAIADGLTRALTVVVQDSEP